MYNHLLNMFLHVQVNCFNTFKLCKISCILTVLVSLDLCDNFRVIEINISTDFYRIILVLIFFLINHIFHGCKQ